MPANLIRVNEAAKRSRQIRFTALLHHVDVESLERAYRRLRRAAAPGVDGMTVATYAEGLAERLRNLRARVHSGRYRPLPVRRTYIPKADGDERPLGIVALEDKIVQGAVAELLSAILLTFERRADGELFTAALRQRLAKFGLQLHEEKTRLIEFGRFATENRKRRGLGRPETFNFLGFTHYCGRTRSGRFIDLRKTQRQRMHRKLKELRREMRRRMHRPVREQHAWLSKVLRGHFAYYGITGNSRCLALFEYQVCRIWRFVLTRRSQRRRMTLARFSQLMRIFPLPPPRIAHVWHADEA